MTFGKFNGIDDVEILRSNRRTVSIEIKRDMRVTVRAPAMMRQTDILKFIDSKSAWIEKHLEIMASRNKEEAKSGQAERFTEEEIKSLASRALSEIPPRVLALAKLIGVSYGRITIRNQTSRWGSCSEKGNLNFNCLLMLCPDEVREYVIIHELCHRKHMDHSKEFWAEVERYCPDYKSRRNWLKENGSRLIGRLK